MAIRRNIYNNTAARDDYIRGVLLLKREFPSAGGLSTYDLFVRWHHEGAMHWGPAFLPWHRHFLIEFEKALRRVLQNPQFAIPYWPWNKDGERPAAQQASSPIWTAAYMGGRGANGVVNSGAFAYRSNDPNTFRVRLYADFGQPMQNTNRGLVRRFPGPRGRIAPTSKVKSSLVKSIYDMAPWFGQVVGGFRGDHEIDHGMVHVWVSGDMEVSTSPNDPVFFLHHCNIDRIWEAWKVKNPGSPYLPGNAAAGANLVGHRIGDRIRSIMPNPPTIGQLVNVSSNYTYDTLSDLVP
jgi:tyrosinase